MWGSPANYKAKTNIVPMSRVRNAFLREAGQNRKRKLCDLSYHTQLKTIIDIKELAKPINILGKKRLYL